MKQIKTCFMVIVNYTGTETGKKRDEIMRALELVGYKNRKKYVGIFVENGCEIIMHKSRFEDAVLVKMVIEALVGDVFIKIQEL